jgi:hypothetical protein
MGKDHLARSFLGIITFSVLVFALDHSSGSKRRACLPQAGLDLFPLQPKLSEP